MYSPYGSYIEHFANTQNNNYMICNLQSCIPVKDVISLCDKEKCIDFNINNIFTETLYNLNIQGPPQNTQGPTPPYMQGPPQNTQGPTPPYMQGPPQIIQDLQQNTQGLVSYVQRKAPSIFDLQRNTHM